MVSKVISAEHARASRWSIPDVDDPRAAAGDPGHGRSVQELEALQQAAYEEAFEQGREAGREAGYEAGLREGRKAAKGDVDRFKSVLDTLSEPVAQLDESVEQQLMEMVFQVAQQVIRREIQTQPGEVVAVIRESIALLPMSAREITVRLHPEDVALVRELWGEDAAESGWKLIEDPGVSRGGCIVQTPSSRIDATLERRIAALCSQMLGGERAGDEAESEDEA
ncbi:flagellar assembly protein FliH [Ectothiorhodospiraceae bacterium WFHF3C12]|nr:flagellar assembly protein FliH [Ectothiorhodospiraceae bacterium WFHF3C12]